MFVRFRNVYLELIWTEDEAALKAVAPEFGFTLLRRPAASPFGIGLRHRETDPASVPFETSSYWAPWMRPLTSIAVARRTGGERDPAVFVVPQYMRWDVRTDAQPELLRTATHRSNVGDVTHVRVHGPGLPSGSEAVRFLMREGLVDFASAESHLLELVRPVVLVY